VVRWGYSLPQPLIPQLYFMQVEPIPQGIRPQTAQQLLKLVKRHVTLIVPNWQRPMRHAKPVIRLATHCKHLVMLTVMPTWQMKHSLVLITLFN
jgi:hypothetical protein